MQPSNQFPPFLIPQSSSSSKTLLDFQKPFFYEKKKGFHIPESADNSHNLVAHQPTLNTAPPTKPIASLCRSKEKRASCIRSRLRKHGTEGLPFKTFLGMDFKWCMWRSTLKGPILLVVFLNFLCPEFVKFIIMSPWVSLQNSSFCRRFQNSGFPRFLGFFEFLKAKKVTLH